jgi:hypothetical protein
MHLGFNNSFAALRLCENLYFSKRGTALQNARLSRQNPSEMAAAISSSKFPIPPKLHPHNILI